MIDAMIDDLNLRNDIDLVLNLLHGRIKDRNQFASILNESNIMFTKFIMPFLKATNQESSFNYQKVIVAHKFITLFGKSLLNYRTYHTVMSINGLLYRGYRSKSEGHNKIIGLYDDIVIVLEKESELLYYELRDQLTLVDRVFRLGENPLIVKLSY